MSRIALQKPMPSVSSRTTPPPARDLSTATPQDMINPADVLIESRGLSVFYGSLEAIQRASFSMPRNRVIAVIGPSGCGKSTFLRSINRLNDLIPGCHVEGELRIAGQNVYEPKVDLVALRQQVGLVFQKPNPFPKSIYDNIAYGPRLQGVTRRSIACERRRFGKR
jgi:phosphate transport system ATP-binding protein